MEKLKELQDLAIWMSGCGYDFTQHEHFLKNKHLLTDEAINYTHSCETLEVFEEIVFEDWLKQHRFTKDINHYIKNNITYREWEVFNMYTMDVYNL